MLASCFVWVAVLGGGGGGGLGAPNKLGMVSQRLKEEVCVGGGRVHSVLLPLVAGGVGRGSSLWGNGPTPDERLVGRAI